MIPTLLAIVLSGVAAGVLLTRWHPLVGLAVAVGSAVAVFAGACALQTGLRLWFPWAIILAVQIPAGLVWGVVFHATKARVQSGVLERSLALYLSPKQVGRLLKHPELLHPGGREQTVSILYSDIANFSKRAERMDAAGLLDWLNQYYARTIACIHEQDGTVVSLIGDAIFALWNAPQEQRRSRRAGVPGGFPIEPVFAGAGRDLVRTSSADPDRAAYRACLRGQPGEPGPLPVHGHRRCREPGLTSRGPQPTAGHVHPRLARFLSPNRTARCQPVCGPVPVQRLRPRCRSVRTSRTRAAVRSGFGVLAGPVRPRSAPFSAARLGGGGGGFPGSLSTAGDRRPLPVLPGSNSSPAGEPAAARLGRRDQPRCEMNLAHPEISPEGRSRHT